MIGYKKITVYKGLSNIEAICTLTIPDDAKKVNPKGSNKWRCNKAVVTKIESLDGNKTYRIGHSCFCTEQGIRGCTYQVDKVVKPNNRYNSNDELECAGGIHYFLTKQEAIDYYPYFI